VPKSGKAELRTRLMCLRASDASSQLVANPVEQRAVAPLPGAPKSRIPGEIALSGLVALTPPPAEVLSWSSALWLAVLGFARNKRFPTTESTDRSAQMSVIPPDGQGLVLVLQTHTTHQFPYSGGGVVPPDALSSTPATQVAPQPLLGE
jgi:hypothetical protein